MVDLMLDPIFQKQAICALILAAIFILNEVK